MRSKRSAGHYAERAEKQRRSVLWAASTSELIEILTQRGLPVAAWRSFFEEENAKRYVRRVLATETDPRRLEIYRLALEVLEEPQAAVDAAAVPQEVP